MKKIVLLFALVTATIQAQELKQVPQISVSGEGKMKVTPDEVVITVAVENIGKEAAEVKKKNDEKHSICTHNRRIPRKNNCFEKACRERRKRHIVCSKNKRWHVFDGREMVWLWGELRWRL